MNAHSKIKEQAVAAGGASHGRDLAHRMGMFAQTLGAGVLAVLYPLESPFYTAGIMLFEAGVLLASAALPAPAPWVKRTILGLAVAGIAVQAAGFFSPEQYAGGIIIAGIGLVCAAGAGIAGTEASRSGAPEGRIIVWLYAGLVFANMAGISGAVLNSVGFSAVFLLLLSLFGRKLRQPGAGSQ